MPDPIVLRSNRLVVDVGNSRIKWGLCDDKAVVQSASLSPDDRLAWEQQLEAWQLTGPLAWALSGVHPQRRDNLAEWLRQRGDAVHLITSAAQLPLEVGVPEPDKVGIDRLLNAVAVNTRRPPGAAAIIIDAGSAVTVDYVDQHGVFVGGAIMPGFRLMSQALHDHTALLPLIEVSGEMPMPANNTIDAMKSGIFAAEAGGIRQLVDRLRAKPPGAVQVFLGGGDAEVLHKELESECTFWPLMTLEGLRMVGQEQIS
jgi:type III pantothenate kinase